MDDTEQKVRRLFETRDRNWENDTGYILKFLKPTLEALYEFFGTPEENVDWVNVDIVEDVVLLTAIIVHKGNDKAPALLTAIAPALVKMEEEVRVVNRLVRVGVPIPLIMGPSNEIIDFLTKRVMQQLEERGITMDDIAAIAAESEAAQIYEQEFDPSELTEEQKISLLMNMHNAPDGVKH